MNRPPLTRATAKAYRRAFRWRMGPGVPPAQPLLSDEASERVVSRADEWDTGQLAAIYPDAGKGWRAPR